MSEARQRARRELKKKMQPIHIITVKGGKKVKVINSAVGVRVQHIREDPVFPVFNAVYEWLVARPPPFGCDPWDPWPIVPDPCETCGEGCIEACAMCADVSHQERSRIDKPKGGI